MTPYRILIVEDLKEWLDMFRLVAARETAANFDFRENVESAKKALAARPVHVASLDQNLPLLAGEMAADRYGFELLEEIVKERPLVRTLMYTKFGATFFGNRAGRLGGTEYFEKQQASDETNGIDVIDYVKLMGILISGGKRRDGTVERGYVHWALGRSRDQLPGMIGVQAGRLHDAWMGSFDSDKASKALSLLIERVAELAWAHASALALHCKVKPLGVRYAPADLAALISDLESQFIVLGRDNHLGGWRGYITESDVSGGWGQPGGRLVRALNRLRNVRNRDAHGAIEALSPLDLHDVSSDLLAVIDALAAWADRPLMYGTRNHPDDRSRLQYQKLVGTTSWPIADILSEALPLKTADRRVSIQFLHRSDGKDQLIDMFPFASMVERAGKPPVPALLLPKPRGYVRRSLISGEIIEGVPVTPTEQRAFAAFGLNQTR